MKNTRLAQIEHYLTENGSVDVKTLSRIFNVSEMTIRRDLQYLSQQDKLVRIHGGAILTTDRYTNGNSLKSRSSQYPNEKRAIAKEAVKLLHSGDNIFIDDSSTSLCMKDFIPHNKQLIITTTSVSTAMEFSIFPNIDVVCLGGKLNKATYAVSGPFALSMLDKMHFKYSFISLPFISPAGGLYSSSFEEFQIKQKVIFQSENPIVLIDSSKIKGSSYLELANIIDVALIITDKNAPAEFIDTCQKLKVPLLQVNC